LYEFACRRCQSTFERLLSFQAADSGVACPSCGAPEARRLISTFAAVSRSSGGETNPYASSGGGGGCCGGGCACGCGH
jgi:putative FmdB family regulatory protein